MSQEEQEQHQTSTTRSQEAACIPILLLGRGITLGRGETMEYFFFNGVFTLFLFVIPFECFFVFFCFSECGIAQLWSKHIVG